MKLLGIVAIVIIIIAVGGFIVRKVHDNSVTPVNNISTDSPATGTSVLVDDDMVSLLRQGGSSYTDPKGVFTFLYPADYKMDTQGDGQYIRFTKIGETQRGQTEIYDGVIMHFEVAELNGKNLNDFVDERIDKENSSGVSEVMEDKTPARLANYDGYKYVLRGLGLFEYHVIAKDATSDNAVIITTLVADPENKNYKSEVDASLSTIELLK